VKIAERTFVDTDVLVDLARSLPRAVQFCRRAEVQGGIACSVISVMELLQGCRTTQDQSTLLKNLADVDVIHVESGDSADALKWYRAYHASQGIGILDCFIAAAASRLDLTVHTLNTKHFRVVPGLQVKRPY
jgi:predicted nucleic acid-binding protein